MLKKPSLNDPFPYTDYQYMIIEEYIAKGRMLTGDVFLRSEESAV